jgi:Predicted xylanase/chitin deacetylase
MTKKYVTFSFDDGTIHDLRFIKLLDQYGLKCTFNLNSGLFGIKNMLHQGELHVDHSKLETEQIAEVYQNHEIAAHTLTHPNLKQTADDEITRQVGEDAKNLEALCGYPMIGMAYPCGGDCYDERTIQLIKTTTNIKYARTTNQTLDFTPPKRFLEWHPTVHAKNPAMFDLAEKFLQTAAVEDDLLFYIWGHSYEFEGFHTWDKIEELFQILSNKNDIQYVTNGEYYKIRNAKKQ